MLDVAPPVAVSEVPEMSVRLVKVRLPPLTVIDPLVMEVSWLIGMTLDAPSIFKPVLARLVSRGARTSPPPVASMEERPTP